MRVTAPEVSVIVPTRNRCLLLLRTLRSVLAQEGVDFEVIVVDDGSTDGTQEALARTVDNRITVIRHERSRGVSAARTAGLERARGSWVAFVDDDDVWSPDKLSSQLVACAAVKGARWSCTGAVWVDDRLRVGRATAPPMRADVADMLLSGNVIPGGASSVLAQTSLVRDVGGFDPSLSNMADWDLWIRLALAAPLSSVDRPFVGYYVHPQSMSHNVGRSEQELEVIEAKYRTERQQRGVQLDRDLFLWYFGAWYLRIGQRGPAMRTHLQIAIRGHDKRVGALLVAAMSLLPGLQALRDRRATRRMPAVWRTEAENWLAPLRPCADEGGGGGGGGRIGVPVPQVS